MTRSEPLSSEERLALRSVRSLESRGAAPTVADVAEHLGSSTEVAVDGDALGRMLDRFVSEGLVEERGDGYALTDGGGSALTDLDDDTSRTTAEPDAVELHTPGSDAPTADPA